MKHFSDYLTGILRIAGTTFLCVFSLFVIFCLPVQGSSSVVSSNSVSITSPVPKIQAVASLPNRIKIPKIRVDALLESVSLTSLGEVGIPKGPVNAAWFDHSPQPGENGSAIITGHYGRWKNGISTVFNNLHQLKAGDLVIVSDKNGKSVRFVVQTVRLYDAKESAPDVFDTGDGKAHLNLITCSGIWNAFSKSYPKRLVVFTDRE